MGDFQSDIQLSRLRTARDRIDKARARREQLYVAVDALIKVGQDQGVQALRDTLREMNELFDEGLKSA